MIDKKQIIHVYTVNEMIYSGTLQQFLEQCANETTDDVEPDFSELKDAIRKGIASVTFTKATGEVRTMMCTTNFGLIPSDKHPVFGAQDAWTQDDIDLMKVFDVEKQEWRSFKLSTIIEWDIV